MAPRAGAVASSVAVADWYRSRSPTDDSQRITAVAPAPWVTVSSGVEPARARMTGAATPSTATPVIVGLAAVASTTVHLCAISSTPSTVVVTVSGIATGSSAGTPSAARTARSCSEVGATTVQPSPVRATDTSAASASGTVTVSASAATGRGPSTPVTSTSTVPRSPGASAAGSVRTAITRA